MKSIRRNVFETNSSSTHSITICTEEEYNKFKSGELYWMEYPKEGFITREEAISKVDESDIDEEDYPNWKTDDSELEELLKDYSIHSWSSYMESEELESFTKKYTTPNGEKIVAFGQYGNQY